MKRLFLAFLACTLLILSACSEPESDTSLYIDVLNVGKADCIVIRHGGKTVMIDTGETENLPEILAFLQSKRIDSVDSLILSHFDKDHIGGVEGILKSLTVDRVIESTFPSDRAEYDIYHDVLQDQEKEPLRITEPYSFALGECQFQVLPPEAERYNKKQDNNASLIVTLEYRGKHFAFFGDAMEDRLKEFISSNQQSFDFVKLPYHGNTLDLYPEFLDNIQCSYAAITCSAKNPASQETLTILEERNIARYLTQNGSISLICDGKTIQIYQ